jgi:hypothetical protein
VIHLVENPRWQLATSHFRVTATVAVALFINIGDASHYERNVVRFAQAEAVEKQVSLHKITRTGAIAQSLN